MNRMPQGSNIREPDDAFLDKCIQQIAPSPLRIFFAIDAIPNGWAFLGDLVEAARQIGYAEAVRDRPCDCLECEVSRRTP